MKNNFLSISKIAFLWLFSASFCVAQQSDNWTEKDWVNYAKAQAYAYDFNINSIKAVFANKSSSFRDSIAMIDIFLPLTFNGVTIRETNCSAPLLNGPIRYYNLNGKLIGEINFKDNEIHGKLSWFDNEGKLKAITTYSRGKEDSSITYYTNGKVATKAIYDRAGNVKEGYEYWSNETIAYQSMYIENAKPSKSEKEMDPNTLKTYIVEDVKTFKESYFDKSGKEIDFRRFSKLFSEEQKKYGFNDDDPHNEVLSDDQVLKNYFSEEQKTKKEFKDEDNVLYNIEFLYKDKYPFVLENIIPIYSLHPLFPNAQFLDSVFYNNKTELLRTCETKKGKINGYLKYYYPNNLLLAQISFKNDYLDGYFYTYYPNGKVQKKRKYNKGSLIDTAFSYQEDGRLNNITIVIDSVRYEAIHYWEDEKTIQRIRKCDGVTLQIQRRKNEKFVRPVHNLTYYYYDKSGLEISEEKFRKLYPQILPQLTRVTRTFK